MSTRRPVGGLSTGLGDVVPHHSHAAWGARVELDRGLPVLRDRLTDAAGLLSSLTLLRSHLAHNYTSSDLLGDIGMRLAGGGLDEITELYRDPLVVVLARSAGDGVDVVAYLDPALPRPEAPSC